ncbi:hypothetical protein RZ75_10620 [Apilactobacillus kunkeei]|uniref:hypothetical protein n=1 Tax=Apilactobacillus kunkeei TaxID=148814 RepID=UPI0006B24E4D|nr:hypothetical protein [Apilactobacillus kunkeei]KOY78564.1 hypothetical protein RZ75_10620 [Apilactobacillus kunkeei]
MNNQAFKKGILIYGGVMLVIFTLFNTFVFPILLDERISFSLASFYHGLLPVVMFFLYYTIASLFKNKIVNIIVFTFYVVSSTDHLSSTILGLLAGLYLVAFINFLSFSLYIWLAFQFTMAVNDIINRINHDNYFQSWLQSISKFFFENKTLIISIIIFYVFNILTNNP